jgi:hypothetical protein
VVRRFLWLLVFVPVLAWAAPAGNNGGPAAPGTGNGSGGTPANPTATAGPAAVNGTATTYMRSDAAPAVQLGTAAQKGIIQCDGSTITCTAGVISAVATGTVTSLTQGACITLTPNPITGTGSVALNPNCANVWSAQQSATITTLTISTATFTPTGASNDYAITLTSACPCTLANPSATPVAGTHGIITVTQSSSGSNTIGTWGSQYEAPGGTASITLSTGANAVDVLSYVVKDSTHILIVPSLNFSH